MNREKLVRLAVIIGSVVTAGGVGITVWQANPDTTAAQLSDAGVLDCPVRLVTCDFHLTDDGVNILADAGITPPLRNLTLAARVAACLSPDGGRDVVLPPMPRNRFGMEAIASPDLGNCTVAADPGGALWRVATSLCVRRQPDAGPNCRWVDGGDPGDWNVIPRGLSSGADCQPAACTRFAGVDDCEEC